MSRPAWLGPPPEGARAAAIMLSAYLFLARGYAECGLPVPARLVASVRDHLEQLITELRAEVAAARECGRV